MTPTTPPARDTAGRFATQDHTDPELTLTEVYLDDDSTGEDFDIDEFYDDTDPATPITDEQWLDQQRHARESAYAEEFFAGPEPDPTSGSVNIFDRSAWESTPF